MLAFMFKYKKSYVGMISQRLYIFDVKHHENFGRVVINLYLCILSL